MLSRDLCWLILRYRNNELVIRGNTRFYPRVTIQHTHVTSDNLIILPYYIKPWVQKIYIELDKPADTSIADFKKYPQVTELHFINWYKYQCDISWISCFSSVKSLSINFNLLRDISFLKDFPALEYLNLENNRINNILVLRHLTNLKTLHLSGNNIMDISVFKYLPNLQKVFLQGNQIKHLTPLEHCKKITHLHIEGLTKNNMNVLLSLDSLINIRLTSLTDDLPVLKKLKNINYCDIIVRKNPYTSFYTATNNITTIKALQKAHMLYTY